MKTWTCWRIRTRIPLWIRGRCSTDEASAIALHTDSCAACAVEAALEAALVTAARGYAAAAVPDRREALWERLVEGSRLEGSSTLQAPGSRPERAPPKSNAWSLEPGAWSQARFRLAIAAALAIGVSLGGWWWAERTGARPDQDSPSVLSLWERQPLMEDPMGPTTERLLALLETPK